MTTTKQDIEKLINEKVEQELLKRGLTHENSKQLIKNLPWTTRMRGWCDKIGLAVIIALIMGVLTAAGKILDMGFFGK